MNSNSSHDVDVYKNFAACYKRGNYNRFSSKMAELLPDILGEFSLHPEEVLDLACGEGTFSLRMAELGYKVTGIDLSEEMLNIARESAGGVGEEVKFIKEDMREISFSREFDLVTCWFDSMNYLKEEREWRQVFANVHKSLRKGGVFIFDMNTLYGLSVEWQEDPCYVAQDKEDVFEVHRTGYDREKDLAILKITGFVKRRGEWKKFEERHKEKAYPLQRIETIFREEGFEKLACWGSLEERTEPDEESGRVWFLLGKKEAKDQEG